MLFLCLDYHMRLSIKAAAMQRVSGVLAGIEARVADWLMVPSFNGEGIQVIYARVCTV